MRTPWCPLPGILRRIRTEYAQALGRSAGVDIIFQSAQLRHHTTVDPTPGRRAKRSRRTAKKNLVGLLRNAQKIQIRHRAPLQTGLLLVAMGVCVGADIVPPVAEAGDWSPERLLLEHRGGHQKRRRYLARSASRCSGQCALAGRPRANRWSRLLASFHSPPSRPITTIRPKHPA